jgi:ABC-type dipeptide/oligopeptide/nickel transport system permease component
VLTYLVRRIVRAIIAVVLVCTFVFVAVRLAGDPVAFMLGEDASPEMVEQIRDKYGLNDSLPIQYFRFLGLLVRGDFGVSLWQGLPASQLVLQRVPATLELAGASMLIALVVALPIGVLSAVRRNTIWDRVVMIVTLMGQSAPTFWVGIMLILIVSVKLRLLPTSGRGSLRHMVLPSITLAGWSMAAMARLTRSAMLDVLAQDYIRTGRAKGLGELWLLAVHAFRNAAIPVVTVAGLQLGLLLSGSIVTETVFAWPGLGRLAVQSIYWRDYPVVQAIVFFVAVLFVGLNLVVDLLYAWLDPRIRYE